MSALRGTQPQLARTEADLIGAVRSGDEGAFGELYSRYGGRILGYVDGIVGDHGRAEDIAQDVFISALRAMRTSDRAIAFKPWIYEIARNACIDEFRRLQRSPEVTLADNEVFAGRQEIAWTAASPDAYMERRQQLDDLRGAFRGLSESQHKVLVLRELEGRSYAQIAERTGMSVPMVESTLFRARRRLGQEYEEIASGRRCEQVVQVIDRGGDEALGALGLRERRRFARHIAHCQPCRRHARLAGIDESALRTPNIAKKIAALLPIPFAPWRQLGGGGRISRAARWLQRTADGTDPGAAAGVGQTALAVAAAAIAVGGLTGGHSAQQVAAKYTVRPAQMTVTPARLWPGPPRTASLQALPSGRPLRHFAKPARRHESARAGADSQAKPGSGQTGSASSSSAGGNTNLSVPSVPSAPGLPSMPLRLPAVPSAPQLLKTAGIGSILHHTRSTTKQVDRLLDKLPTSLTNIIHIP
jgi:RNA polymerase sigma factor (sigma-70 family)